MVYKSYFTDYSTSKGIFYALALMFMFGVMIASVLEPFVVNSDETCRQEQQQQQQQTGALTFENSLYVYNPCRFHRFRHLLWLTPEECCFVRRLVASVLLGGIIGWERRQADRPAGIRTMALVSLGSALFTINSAYAFVSGPMAWDASRISAAIPSGVGFLGAGLIFKEAEKDKETGGVTHVVHGLTTAASLWLSAAVGVACGGALYVAAAFCVAIMLVLLRFGPRHDGPEEDVAARKDEEEEEAAAEYKETTPLYPRKSLILGIPPSMSADEHSEASSMVKRRITTSIRNRAHLGGIM